ncbi:rhodanese-like domain-containing protein [Roseateles sp.]|uniref:rhodanese-like domain-containing protein n=1 Tax=Roseateles sp. TaxID=1971397 RepID=UPI00286BC043|nr:rhodanese-like domain-containing protein [Roseateles sp.]
MQQIGPGELLALCSGSHPPLLLDVREPWEAQLASIRIDGVRSVLLPMGQIPARLSELEATQPVVCYCHHGVRSLQVVAFLQRAGFDCVYNLAGGIDAWSLATDPSVPRY